MINHVATVNASRTLKVVGIILILSFLLDVLILLFPFQPTNRGWQIELATALVDRGIVPLVGLGMLFVAYWIDSVDEASRPGIDLRFPVLILSSILGLVFLLIFPLHLNNVRQASEQTVEQINLDAQQAENQLQGQLNQLQARLNSEEGKAQLEKQRSQVRTQFTELLNNEERYKQAIANPSLPPEQKKLLQDFKKDPQKLDQYIASQSDPQQLVGQQLSQVRQRQEAAQRQAKQRAWKSGLRIGMSSLLLAIGYIIIGWTGLRGMGAGQKSARKATAR